MKWMSLIVAAGLVFGVAGCTGEKDKNKGTVKGEGGAELTVEAPSGTTSVTVGKDKDITVSITRKKFDDPVSVTLSDLPEGVTADPKTQDIAKGETKAKFTLKAAGDAKESKGQKVKVTAKGGKMEKSEEFTVDVVKK